MKYTLIAAMISLFWVAGCGVQKRNPAEKKTFLLDVQRPADIPTVKPNACLRIRFCQVASPYSARSLIYRIDAVQVETDYYHLFLTSPDDHITELMNQWLRSGGFQDCVADKKTPNRYTLNPKITVLCADFRDRQNPVATVQMHLLLTQFDPSCSCPKIVLDKTLTARTPVPPTPTAAQVVEGLSVSLSKILEETEQFIQTEMKSE